MPGGRSDFKMEQDRKTRNVEIFKQYCLYKIIIMSGGIHKNINKATCVAMGTGVELCRRVQNVDKFRLL